MSVGFDVLIEVNGPVHSLDLFQREQLGAGTFSFASVMPMPAELDLPVNNFVEDGFDALYGEWSKLSGRWMFKEIAMQRGYPFPLTSRDQVLECVRALGEDGARRLDLGRRFQSNLERHGYGYAAAWCKAHWGVETDVDEVVAEVTPDSVALAFRSDSPFPNKVLAQLSKRYPELRLAVFYVNEAGNQGRKFVLQKGRKAEMAEGHDDEIKARIIQFRRAVGLSWLSRREHEPDWIAQVEMNERGRPVFKGTTVAIDFALSRLAAGETPEQLQQRFSLLSGAHIQALKALAVRRQALVVKR